MYGELEARRVFGWIAVLVTAHVAWAQADGYSVTELEPLETAVGTMTSIDAWAINNSGHVVGVAVLPGDQQERRAAFFFSPQTGMRDLDPDGDYHSEAQVIHDQGWIYGIRNIAASPRPFLYDGNFKLDNLEKNANKVLAGISPFTFWDMNAFGDLAGCGQSCTKPVLYTQEEGWLDLSGVDPRFRPNTVARLINDIGDLVFTIGHPGGFQESFVLLGGEELVELGHFGTPVNVPTDINNSRLMSGISRTAGSDPNVQADGDDHAYLYTPRQGVVDIHRKRFRASSTMGVTSGGVVVGDFRKKGHYERGADGIFTYDRRPGKNLRILAKRKQFRKMFPRGTGFQFLNLGEVYFNERLEFIGSVQAPPTDEFTADPRLQRFFFLSEETGLLDLQQVLNASGYEGEIVQALDINDRGQILLAVERPASDDPSTSGGASVILTPFD